MRGEKVIYYQIRLVMRLWGSVLSYYCCRFADDADAFTISTSHKKAGSCSIWLKPLPFATRSNERTKNVTQNTVQRHHAHHDCIIFSDLFLPGVAVIDRCVNECVPNYSVIFHWFLLDFVVARIRDWMNQQWFVNQQELYLF